MNAGEMRAAEAAAAAGVHVETLRYYERRGLLDAPNRTLGGHRLYTNAALTSLRVIKAAQRLGFTLAEVAELLDAGAHHHGRRDRGLRSRAAGKLAEVEQKIADLQVISQSLRRAIDAGCDDLAVCAEIPGCPLPFADLFAVDGRRR
jgi:MerR family mercuric resistance operon transcriptional regulator